MQIRTADVVFSTGLTTMLNAIAQTAPHYPEPPDFGADQAVRYLSGVLSADEAADVEAAAVKKATLRRRLSELLPVLERFQEVPYGELIQSVGLVDSEHEARSEWIGIIDRHVETVSAALQGPIPTTWPALARMAKQSEAGLIAARTIWMALFGPSNPSKERQTLHLGFGYRLGSRGKVQPARLLTSLQGQVLPNGDLEILASTDFGPREGALFFAFSMNGRALPLGEAVIKDGQAKVLIEGLAQFLKLPVGPIPANSLAAGFDDWPENCKLGQVMIETAGVAGPSLEMPVVRGGQLELTVYFEDRRLDGKWELLLAVSPNSWQMLAKFDIKCVIERPQVLKAIMPRTVEEGPFGGAIRLRRQNRT